MYGDADYSYDDDADNDDGNGFTEDGGDVMIWTNTKSFIMFKNNFSYCGARYNTVTITKDTP